MKKVILLTAFAVPVFLASCGNGNQSDNSQIDNSMDTVSQTDTMAASPGATTNTATDDVSAANTFALTGNDQMKFNIETIKVKTGDKVKITLTDVGTVPKQAMGHDFVLLKPGTDVKAFAEKANESKATDYIPTAEQSSIVAHTRLLGPGESDTIVFTVPDKGEYDYICTFPGHYMTMRGKLIAE